MPLEDHVLVEPYEHDTTTASGIVLTDTKKEKPWKGTVIAVGPGKMLDNGLRSPMDVQVGDTIHFTKYSPDEITVGPMWQQKTYLVISHHAILAVEK